MSNKQPKSIFSKEQHLKSKKWSGIERDMIAALLEEEASYSTEEVVTKLKQFMKKGVK
ncbi:hypothetical protein [Paenibacillus sp. IITD108]|uniref:hypothetical protein n=1 Tax=Paenibacillus sp. IITD108 TaxID=3116649 RepID=UPI002F41D611